MDENKAVDITKKYIESQFPKTCPKCGMRFNSLAEYLLNTTHVGDPVSYDADDGDWTPKNPIGTASYATCKSCRTTLAISSKGMNLITMWKLLAWARMESRKRGISMSELLKHIRQEIDRRVLSGE